MRVQPFAAGLVVMGLIGLLVVGCGSTKVAYRATEPDPNDVPPSPRFTTALMALKDELPKHGGQRSFYLCVGPDELKAFRERLPEYDFHPASETYTEKDADWPVDFVRSYATHEGATRVHIQFESVATSEIQLTLFVAATYPNLQVVCYTFRRQGSTWSIHHHDRPETPKI